MTKYKQNTAQVAQNVGKQISRHSLTTVAVAAKTLCAGDRDLAEQALEALRRRGRIYLHGEANLPYYARTKQPLCPPDVHRSFATLWYCCMMPPAKQLLAPGRLFKLKLPKLPCYVTRDGPLTWIRVHPRNEQAKRMPLRDALISLQEPVRRPQFEILAHFAREKRFAIDYLMTMPAQAAELRLWIERHRVFTNLVDPPAEIPVNVVALPPVEMCT